ncbi:MAG: transposase, partial [Gemmatimonadales bacterium]
MERASAEPERAGGDDRAGRSPLIANAGGVAARIVRSHPASTGAAASVPAANQREIAGMEVLRAVDESRGAGDWPWSGLAVARSTATYRSDKTEGPTAGNETVDALEFLARLVTHIPDRGQVLTRSYWWYAYRTRGIRRRALGRVGAPDLRGRSAALPAVRECH